MKNANSYMVFFPKLNADPEDGDDVIVFYDAEVRTVFASLPDLETYKQAGCDATGAILFQTTSDNELEMYLNGVLDAVAA